MDYITLFNLESDLIYLNHAAVAPWPRKTVEAVKQFAIESGSRGSLDYPRWVVKEGRLRERLARLINAPQAEDVALVKNTSEALSFVAMGVEWREGENIVSSDEEFPSNRIVWEALAEQGVQLRQANLWQEGLTPEEALIGQVDEKTRMIAISSVQYGTGLRMDLQRLGDFCRARNILFCVDAIQSIGAEQVDVQRCHIDFLAADGHKWMLGPEGLGMFYVREELREQLKLTQYGWHMVEKMGDFEQKSWQPAHTARRFEAGSPNMLTVHALEASVALLETVGLPIVEQRVKGHARTLASGIEAIDGLEVITPMDEGRHCGIVTFRATEGNNDELFDYLNSEGVFCARRGGGVRFSPHFYLTPWHLEQALEKLSQWGTK